MKQALGLLAAALLALGCGTSKKVAQHDAGVQHDGGMQLDVGTPPDASGQQDAFTCGFSTNLGDLTFASSEVGLFSDLDPASSLYFDGYLNSLDQPDVFEMELFAGYGVFTNGIATGTYQLAGDDLQYQTCGLCVRLLTKVDLSNWNADQYFMVTGGTVTLTSVSGRLTGSVSNLTFTHVSINQNNYQSTPLNDGCDTQVAAASFDGEIVAPDGGFLQYDAGTD